MDWPPFSPPDPRSTCYILYSEEDGSAYARALARSVAATGRRVAPLAPSYAFRGAPPGTKQFDAVVFIATAAAVRSRYLLDEVDRAWEAGYHCVTVVCRPHVIRGGLPTRSTILHVDEDLSGFQSGVPTHNLTEHIEGALHGFDVASRM